MNKINEYYQALRYFTEGAELETGIHDISLFVADISVAVDKVCARLMDSECHADRLFAEQLKFEVQRLVSAYCDTADEHQCIRSMKYRLESMKNIIDSPAVVAEERQNIRHIIELCPIK